MANVLLNNLVTRGELAKLEAFLTVFIDDKNYNANDVIEAISCSTQIAITLCLITHLIKTNNFNCTISNINQSDREGQTLVTVATHQREPFLPLLNVLAEQGGDWTPILKKNPGYFFTIMHTATDHVHLLPAVLRRSTNLLQCNNRNQTILMAAIAAENNDALKIILAHIRNLVISKEHIAYQNTPIPIEQLQQCFLILEHCMHIFKDALKSENKMVLDAFKETELDLLYGHSKRIYQKAAQDSTELNIRFCEGLLNFLRQYRGEALPLLPSRYIPSLVALSARAINNMPTAYRDAVLLMPKIEGSYAEKTIRLMGEDTYNANRAAVLDRERSTNQTKFNSVVQRIAALPREQAERERAQIEAQLRRDNQIRIDAENRRLALRDIEKLPGIREQILGVLLDLSQLMNARDREKIKRDRIDLFFSSTTFLTALVFFIRAALQNAEPSDEYNNLQAGGISLAVFWATRFCLGFYNSERDDLRLNDLDEIRKPQVTQLIALLKTYNLRISDDNPSVEVLLEEFWQTTTYCVQRVANAHALLQSQNTPLPAVVKPDLLGYVWEPGWNNNRSGEERFFTYLCCVGAQGVVSLFGCWSYKDRLDSNNETEGEYGDVSLTTSHKICYKLGGFVAIQLGVFPAHWIGLGFHGLGQASAFYAKPALANLWQNGCVSARRTRPMEVQLLNDVERTAARNNSQV
jgi:hypothetical protein